MNYRKLQRKLNYEKNSHTILPYFLRDLTSPANHGKVMIYRVNHIGLYTSCDLFNSNEVLPTI